MKKIFLTTLLLTVCVGIAFAQAVKVSGTVRSSDDGQTLVGASILIKGTSKHALTNVDGQYSIDAKMSDVLVFQFVGYETQEQTVSGATLDVTLVPEANTLDEVMVVAYGTAKKASFTGSAAVMKKDAIQKSQVSSVSKALQGTVPGVQSASASGQPGSDAEIRIRGIGSINASSSPLYVLDGAPYSGTINSINPADIESITVLKDAASSALYGSRGANGVIIITTKQGRRDQKPRIEAKFTYGVSGRAVKDYERISTNDYFELYWEALRNQRLYINKETPEKAAQFATNNILVDLAINPYGTTNPEPVGLDGKLKPGLQPLWDDDWVKANEQTAVRTEALVSFSGGSKASTYFASLGYLNDRGIAIGSGFKRYSGRISLTSDLTKWLTFSGNVSLTHSLTDAPASEDSSSANVVHTGRLIPNFYPVWLRNWTTGEFILDGNGNRIYDFGDYRPSSASPKNNLAGSVPYNIDEQKRDVATVRASLDAKILEGLSFKTTVNIDYTNRVNHNYTNPLYGAGASSGGSVSKYNHRTVALTNNNILTYNAEIGDRHEVKALAGHEYYEYNYSTFGGNRSNFVLPYLYEPIAASVLGNFSGHSDIYKLLSFFGNFEYNYDNKYFASASIRTDGSSRFHPDTRWGTFWSLGGSWRVSNEDFIKSTPWVSNLTLRVSYGAQGNDELSTYYEYLPLYSIRNNLGEGGVVPYRLPTPELKWETNMNLNIGLDFGLFSQKLTGTIEFFDRRSKDLLFSAPRAASTGFTSMPSNIGSMKNVGFEVSLNGTVLSAKDLKWDIFANATHYKNTITSLPQASIILGNKRMVVGGSLYDFFIAEWAGIDQETGLPQWYATNTSGNRYITGDYSVASSATSKINAGSSLPDLLGGFGTNFSYKDVEFSCLFAYSIGGKIYNGDSSAILHNGQLPGRAWSTEVLNRWTPENKIANYPRLQSVNTNWTSTSTRFLVDADYLRLKNVMLSYSLPKQWLSKVNISQCKVFVLAENLLTVFGEKGMDPEQTIDGNTYYRYPAMKTISFGINLSL